MLLCLLMKIYGNNSFYNFAIFGQIFMKLSPKCSLEQQTGNIKHHFGNILQFLNWELQGQIFCPRFGLGKSWSLAQQILNYFRWLSDAVDKNSFQGKMAVTQETYFPEERGL